jgi:hypothetical protein
MRLPRLRFTVRRWMIAVAAIAVLIFAYTWGGEMRKRRAYYMSRAQENADVARCFDYGFYPKDDPTDLLYQIYKPQHDHFKRLELRYRRAAARPWISIEPDPPSPF